MKLTLESTSQIVELETPTGVVPGRVWRGRTERGVECFAVITRIAVHRDDDNRQFAAELVETPSLPASGGQLRAFPARLVL